MPFFQSSAFVVGSNHVNPFYVAALAPLAFVITGGPRSLGRQASIVLIVVRLMTLYMAMSAVIFPQIFAGIAVLVPRGGIDAQANDPGVLRFAISNVAQVGYLVLSVAVVLFFIQNRPSIHFLYVGFAVGTLLNAWALAAQLAGIPFPEGLFHVTVAGQQGYTSYLGTEIRLRGIYTEPSNLALFSLAAGTYYLFMIAQRTGRRRIAPLVLSALNVGALYFSYSGTAALSLAIMAAIMVAAYTFLFLTGRLSLRVEAAIALCGVVILLIPLWPTVYAYGREVITLKLTSASYANRTNADKLSWQVFERTYGLGAGLGSSRPSSFFFTLLSTVGVVGTSLFALLVFTIVRTANAATRYRPEVWALTATLIAKIVAEPNVAQPVMWLLLGACAASLSPELAKNGNVRAPRWRPHLHAAAGVYS